MPWDREKPFSSLGKKFLQKSLLEKEAMPNIPLSMPCRLPENLKASGSLKARQFLLQDSLPGRLFLTLPDSRKGSQYLSTALQAVSGLLQSSSQDGKELMSSVPLLRKMSSS